MKWIEKTMNIHYQNPKFTEAIIEEQIASTQTKYSGAIYNFTYPRQVPAKI